MTHDPAKDISDVLRDQIHAEKELSERLQDFAGEWVAVRNHTVVAHADSLAKLLKTVDPDEVEVFQVAEEQATACFF
jgi:hypothetical protein